MADVAKINVNGTDYNVKDATARTTASAAQTTANSKPDILYFYQQAVSSATSAEIMRITNSAITADTVVLECTFANPSYIRSDINWTSAAGYISFTGTCVAATTANVTLAKKSN